MGLLDIFTGKHPLGPLLLLTFTPPFAIAIWYTCTALNGSLADLFNEILNAQMPEKCSSYIPNEYLNYTQMILSPISFFYNIWPTVFDPVAWTLLGKFALFELILMRIVPGKPYYAPETATGHVPKYKANGPACFFITIIVVVLSIHLKYFNPSDVYDHFGPIIASLNLFSLIFCFFLYIKGLFLPSTADSGQSGNGFIQDYFWGMELYPRVLGWDIKQFTNCRFGMMYWAVGLICYAYKQKELYGEISDSMLVSITLQLIYIAKFFWWETGYFASMDIQHDRAGYYICWGCLVWVPMVYTSQGFYLVNHPVHLGDQLALTIFVLGFLSIWMNYDADHQRQYFRKTGGKAKIWGKLPNYITAHYVSKDGIKKESLLLSSGWWGMSRHFHYIPEIMASFFWSAPALFENFLPYFYVVYLTILLVHRAFRDDDRCSNKYGKDWQKYKTKVRSLIIPGIF